MIGMIMKVEHLFDSRGHIEADTASKCVNAAKTSNTLSGGNEYSENIALSMDKDE